MLAHRPGMTVAGANPLPRAWAVSALAQTPATDPDDPRVGQLLAQLFQVLFTDAPLFGRPGVPFFRPF